MSEYEGWALLELMGHRVRPGYVKEVEIAGTKMLRVDIPLPGGLQITEFYNATAVYALRPATEELVRHQVDRWTDVRPIRPLDYRERAIIADQAEEDDDAE